MPEIVLLLPIAAVLGLVLYLAYGLRGLLPARARQVERFAARHGLQPTPASTDHLRQQLTRGARLRVVAVICVAVTVGLRSGGGLDLQVVLAAVVAGTLLTELTLARPAPSPTRSASLRPRELPAYLSRPLLWGPAAAGAAAALAWACVPALGADTDGWTKPSGVRVAVGILLALAVPPAAAAACRWIVQRPQPLVGADLVAADDALRTASVRRIAAVACVMGCSASSTPSAP